MFPRASSFANQVDGVFWYIVGVSLFFFVGIVAFMIYCAIKYNRKKRPFGSHIEGNVPLEIIWTLVPTLVVLTMFYYGWVGFKDERTVPKDAMVVDVTASMWSWLFEYQNGKQSEILFVPVGKPVRLNMYSQDVIHSFFVPAFRIKEDIVPEMSNYMWFKATETGVFDVFCAEYCGLRHSKMLSKVIVLSQEDFDSLYHNPKALKPEEEEEEGPPPGKALTKVHWCFSCHTTDGSTLVGPSFKGIFGAKRKVMTGDQEREITVDDGYLRKSMLEPNADIVKGTKPLMPSYKTVITEQEMDHMVDYLKTLK